MTGQRDIERTLDAWFVDGASVMPDRLFDAVLDQVERTPQRPLARLRLRLTEMNPRIRYFTVAATALLAVIAAIALIGGGSKGPVSATASPQPSSGVSAVPQELRALWMGGTRSIQGLDADAGVSLTFGANGTFSMNGSLTDRPNHMLSSVESVDADRFRLTTDNATQDCGANESGEYRWSLSTSGETLELTAVADACANRLAAVPGTYWRMDCPTDEDNCIGTIDSGTYGSQFFDPFVFPGAEWSPRYGALTYTVNDGWSNVADWPGDFKLQALDATGNATLYLFSDIVALNEADQCVADPEPSVGRTADDLKAWIVELDGVVATSPAAVSLGGLDGWRLDVSIDPGWTETCPFSEGKPSRGLFVDSTAEGDFHWGIPSGSSMRLWLLDLGDGRTLLIDYEADTQAGFDAGLAEATDVVETFDFAASIP